MQLIDTEIDIGVVNSKMSTIPQESLEKFSIIENVCNAIATGNDECSDNQEVDECKNSFDKNEQTSHCTDSRRRPLLNRENNIELKSEVCDKESEHSMDHDKLENYENVQYEQITEKSNALITENLEIEVNNVVENTSSNKNQIELLEESEEVTEQDVLCNTVLKSKIKAQNDDCTEYIMDSAKNDSIDVILNKDDKVKDSLTDDKIIHITNDNSKIENCYIENSEMDVTFDEAEIANKSLTEYPIEDVTKENGTKDDKKSDQKEEEDIEMNVTFEEDKTTDIVEEDRDIEMEVTFEEEDKINDCLTEDKTDNILEENKDIEMDVPFEEEHKVNDCLTEDKTKDIVEEDNCSTKHKTDDVVEENKDIEMQVPFEEEHKVNDCLTEDKTKDVIEEDNCTTKHKTDDVVEENKDIKMQVPFEEEHAVDNCLTEDKTKDVEDNCSRKHNTEFKDNSETEPENSIENKSNDKVKESSRVGDTNDKQTLEDVELNVINDTHLTEEIKDKYKELNKEEKDSSENISEDTTPIAEQDKIDYRNLDIEEVNNKDHSVIEDPLEKIHTERNEILVEGPEKKETNETQVKGTDETDNTENEDKNNLEKDNNTEYQNKVNISATGHTNENEGKKDSKVGHELEKIDEQKNLNNQDNIITKTDDIEIKEKIIIEDKLSVKITVKGKNETNIEIEKISRIPEQACDQADQERDTEDLEEKQHDVNFSSSEDVKQTQVQDKPESLIEGTVNKEKETSSTVKIKEDQNLDQIAPIIEPKYNNTTQDTGLCENIQQDCGYNEKVVIKILEETTNDSNDTTNYTTQSAKIQEIQNHNIENETECDENMISDIEQKLEKQNDDKESNTLNFNSKSKSIETDNDEIINIIDEKDDELNLSDPKKNSAVVSTDTQANEPIVKNANTQEEDNNNSETELNKKKTLTRVSKLSNTLDILSDDEEDLQKNEKESQKDTSVLDEKQCTSINIDDDDDIMLIDEESNSIDSKSNTNSLPKTENRMSPEKELKVESKDQEENCLEIAENKKDIVLTNAITPNDDEIKTNDSKEDIKAQEEVSLPKKPLMQVNFLKTCAKNIADMTRDELEDFCILKIVESVVERSNVSEVKAQIKALAQSVEDYKKKASILARQNRDLQLVLKSVQEEQKKKPNAPITPLKITRSVGMQVLMSGAGARKKANNSNLGQANTASNGGRQGKAAQNQSKLQKILSNTNSPAPIPVPRLVPAVNNNSNNGKAQSPNANATGKQMPVSVTSSPVQSASNGLPVTPVVPKPEKRSHSRMQQSNNAFTVDLTDDEPPPKVISRNVTPPVRLVPPQNLLAPNRQPFGTAISNPRKVYIPISGSQTPVGVRAGQTIMLKAIAPQGPRQRVPTPGVVKPHQSPNTIRMQRMPASRHPAPLPDSVKQYQPVNWKALPPAPDLKLSKVDNGIVISWKIDEYVEDTHEEIASYQLYAYQETSSPPSTTLWKKIGDVKALPLPMACTLTQFMAGFKYYFAVRAVDIRSRLGPFSLPGSILLLNKM